VKLTGTVIAIESASEFVDNIERVIVRVDQADTLWSKVRIRNDVALLNVNDKVTIDLDIDAKEAQSVANA
jgi:hypothetical protein